MTLRVLLFASWADAIGRRELDVDVAEGATADDVLAAVRERAGDRPLPRPALAINRFMARGGDLVRSGDELALIPPVAGG
jgi:molybdopterin converting factor small subunit